MLRILPLVLLVACSGQHRPVGSVGSMITDPATITRVELHNVAGTIELRAADQAPATVDVEVLLVEKRPETDFISAFAEHVEMVRDGDRLTIRNRHADQPDSNDWQLKFALRVPAGVALDIRQVAGTVDLQLPSARDVEVHNTAGQIELAIAVIDGQLTVESQAGELQLRIADRGPTGGCDVRCTAGSVSLLLPQEVHGEFDLGTTAGDIDAAGRFGLDVKRAIASVTAKGAVGQGGPRFRVRSTAGSIEVR